MKGYPRSFLPSFWALSTALLISGLLLAPTTLDLRLGWDMAWRLPGAARIGTAAVHAGLSFVACMLIGSLWAVHMRAGWRKRRQRRSGSVLLVLLLTLVLSAVGIYYLGDSGLADGLALLHLAGGLALLLPLGWHVTRGRRGLRRRHL
jgi:heme A synthase